MRIGYVKIHNEKSELCEMDFAFSTINSTRFALKLSLTSFALSPEKRLSSGYIPYLADALN